MTPLADAGVLRRGALRPACWLWPHRPAGTIGSTVTSNHSRSRGSPLMRFRARLRALGMKWRFILLSVSDFGSPICCLVRPDAARIVFRSCVMMSAPYRPAPPVGSSSPCACRKFVGGLADLERPRKHLHVWYYSTPEANDDMRNCPQGIRDFLRAYFPPREERRMVGQ